MFARLSPPERPVSFFFEGREIVAEEGSMLAASLLAAGVTTFRQTAVSGAPRGPYCMMGVCFECLVTVDGRSNQQACMVRVAPGMRVERQSGAAAP